MRAVPARLKLTGPPAVLALLCAGYILSFFHRVCPSVLAGDMMRDFALDATSFSLISSATMLGYAATQIPSGLLADIVGGRRTLALYQAFAGTFCILFALSHSLASAVAWRFLLGFTLASNIPSYKILASLVPAKNYAKYCSALTGCGAVGTLLAASPLVTAAALAGWRAALIAAGLFTLFLGCAILVLLRDPGGAGEAPPPSARENIRALKQGLGVTLRMKNFWFIFLWFMFMVGNMFVLLTTWWGSYLMQANGLSREAAGLSISIMSLVPLLFLVLSTWLSDNVLHSRRVFLLAAALLESIVLARVCLHREGSLSFAELTVLGTLINSCTTCMGPLAFAMVRESVPAPALASASGFMNCSAPVAAALLQSLFGVVLAWRAGSGATQAAAYGDAFLPLLAGSVLAFAATLFMKDTFGEKA